jgi:DNA-binding NtrC family response regulator
MPEDLSTVLRQRPRAVVDVSATFTLTIVEGRDAGLSFSLDGARPLRAYVGTSPACDLRLEDRHVSRRHVGLDVRRDRLRVNDLHSTNGTLVDGLEIAEAFLRGGEHLTLGETVLRVELAAPEAQHPISPASRFGRVLGESVVMRRLYPWCERLATSDVPVVIEGETGTGKELLAESIHEASARSEKPFVVFDCTTIPNELVEATLFGAEAGALGPGSAPRAGVFEQASGGTLLIDEIAELDPRVQPKLLRAIERREIRRVGAERAIRVDVRILAATRRDLELEVQAGRLRDDLFFRLAVARIELPPLRERIGDAAVLADHFWRKLSGNQAPLPDDLRAQCAAYPWPGNVRELENLIARRGALGDLPPAPPRFASGSAAPPSKGVVGDSFIDRVLALDLPLTEARTRVVDHFEGRYVEQVLAAHGGNIARAAAASGIARRYFQILRARHVK